MNQAADRVQACSRCGAELEVAEAPVGSWLACPDCGQPLQVRARPVTRPVVVEIPESEPIAWIDDPRLGGRPLPEPEPTPDAAPGPEVTPTEAPAAAPGPKAMTPAPPLPWERIGAAPPPVLDRRPPTTLAPLIILAGVAGMAQLVFGNLLLGPLAPRELGLCAGYGFLSALVIAALSRSVHERSRL